MNIQLPSEDDVAAQALAVLRNRFPNRDSGVGSFLDLLAKTFAMWVLGIQKSAADADNDSIPSDQSSTAALDYFAFLFGVASNTPGVYGRKTATAAAGGIALCTGTNGTIYPDQAVLTAPDGATLLALSGSVTIPGTPPGSGSISGAFIATTLGTVGNLAAGTTLTWQSPPAGSDGTVTLTTGLNSGTDTETNSALLTRILERLQQPPKGGVAADYRAWAESQTGIARAYSYPLRGGTGTIHLVLIGPGNGTGRKPSSGTQTTVDNYINGSATTAALIPYPADYTSFIPFMAASGLTIRVRMVAASTKYAFNWSSGTTSYTVSAYTAGPPATLTLSPAPPADLVAAAAAGSKPKIQLVPTGATTPVPQQVGVVSIVGSVLTLDTVPTGWVAPTNGDAVYSGGPMVTTIATALQSYIDLLGPSRASGYADPLDSWEDKVAIFRLSQIALDQTDTDGTSKFANNVTAVTINGSASDVIAADATSNPPELLWAAKIFITD